MPIKLISLTCPSCGGQLEMPVDTKDFYCQYCGTHVYADDGSTKLNINANINQTVTIRDEAALRRLDIEERRERERQEKDRERQERRSPSDSADYRKRWLRILIGYPISFILVFIGTALISAIINTVFELNTDTLDDILVMIVVLYLFIGFPIWVIYLILKRPRKRE